MVKKVLIVTYGGGHSKLMLPVIRELMTNKELEIIILALTTSVNDYKYLGLKLYGYKDFFFSEEALVYGKELVTSLENVMDLDESIIYLGQNFKELVDRFGLKKAKELYKKAGRQVFDPIDSMGEILDQVKPDVVVITDSPRSERAIGFSAKIRKIPILMLIGLFPFRGINWLSNNSISDKVCVFSKEIRQILIDAGRNENSVIVTGNPTFDEFIRERDRLKVANSNTNESSSFKILWASQIEPEYCFDIDKQGNPNLPVLIENELIRLCSLHSNWELIARNHPNEVARIYPRGVYVSKPSEPLIDVLNKVDCVVTTASAVGLQGAILGVKLITVDCSILTAYTPYSEVGLSIGVQNISDLESALIHVADELNGQDSIYEINNSAELISKEIVSLI